jgi:GTP-binding protein HflX
MNGLTDSHLSANDNLFETLDSSVRILKGSVSPRILVTDTVGFIRKLPTQLIEAFKATLEESAEADVLLHVVDLSSPNMARQLEVVDKLIEEFKWQDKKIITVFNKIDAAPVEMQFKVKAFPRIFVSAMTGQGIEQLKKMMADSIHDMQEDVELYFPKAEEYKIYDLSRDTRIVRKESATEGTICVVQMTPALINQWRSHIVK